MKLFFTLFFLSIMTLGSFAQISTTEDITTESFYDVEYSSLFSEINISAESDHDYYLRGGNFGILDISDGFWFNQADEEGMNEYSIHKSLIVNGNDYELIETNLIDTDAGLGYFSHDSLHFELSLIEDTLFLNTTVGTNLSNGMEFVNYEHPDAKIFVYPLQSWSEWQATFWSPDTMMDPDTGRVVNYEMVGELEQLITPYGTFEDVFVKKVVTYNDCDWGGTDCQDSSFYYNYFTKNNPFDSFLTINWSTYSLIPYGYYSVDLEIPTSMLVVDNVSEIKKTEMPLGYPNPATSDIKFTEQGINDPFVIVNSVGETVMESNYLGSIDISMLDAGVYYFRSNNLTTRFIKQ